jgi:hypothetical protein
MANNVYEIAQKGPGSYIQTKSEYTATAKRDLRYVILQKDDRVLRLYQILVYR